MPTVNQIAQMQLLYQRLWFVSSSFFLYFLWRRCVFTMTMDKIEHINLLGHKSGTVFYLFCKRVLLRLEETTAESHSEAAKSSAREDHCGDSLWRFDFGGVRLELGWQRCRGDNVRTSRAYFNTKTIQELRSLADWKSIVTRTEEHNAEQ